MGGVRFFLVFICAGWLSGAAWLGGEPNTIKVADKPVWGSEETGQTAPEEINGDLWEELEMDDVDEMVEELLPDEKVKFSDIVFKMITGETKELGATLWDSIKARVGYELTESRTNLIQLLFLAAIGAIFTQLAAGFGSAAVSEIGFYLTYLMMFGLLMSSFTVIYELVSTVMTSMIRLMEAVLPVFFIAVAFSGKATTSVVFSELSTIVITVAEGVNRGLLLPGVKLFLLLTLANHLAPEPVFAKFSELVKMALEWGAKTVLGLVLGLSVVKGMCAPLQDSLSSGTMTRVLSAIPGIGNTVDSAAGLVLGSARLIKNGIGVASMVCLVLVSLVPVLKLAAATLLHYGTAALLEPVADARLTAAVAGTAQAMRLLLKLLVMAMILFFLLIALICSVTG